MFAIGHFALGYLTGKGSSKALKTKINIPLILTISVIPDIDLILQMINPVIMHRGPTHSIITLTVLMFPFLIIYRKQAVPYYAALLSHSLIGDFFTGGIEMLWPISQHWFGNTLIVMASTADVIAELALFAVATAIMFKSGDLRELLSPNRFNLILIIGFAAVLGPMLSIGSGIESNLPIALVFPSIFWLLLFAYSMLVELRHRFNNLRPKIISKETKTKPTKQQVISR